MSNERKIQKSFLDHGFGFPVRLVNVPMVKVRGHWTPEIDYNKLAAAVLRVLAHKPSRLTGFEVKFIRNHFGMTLQVFAKRFNVSHVAVLKWEKTGRDVTAMSWAIEKDLRLFALSHLSAKPQEMVGLYSDLEKVPPTKSKELAVDLDRLAA